MVAERAPAEAAVLGAELDRGRHLDALPALDAVERVLVALALAAEAVLAIFAHLHCTVLADDAVARGLEVRLLARGELVRLADLEELGLRRRVVQDHEGSGHWPGFNAGS